VGMEILTVICPDWRSAALVLNAKGNTVIFANWHCITMLSQGSLMHLIGDRLAFRDSELDRKFQLEVERLVASGAENAFVIGREPTSANWISVTLRNGQGFFRDALESNLGKSAPDHHLVVVEITAGDDRLDPAALAVFAETALLSPAEAELVEAVVGGHSLSAVARLRGIAVSTVRRRMRSVLGKTGCRRQAELLRLVLSLCPKAPSMTQEAGATRRADREFGLRQADSLGRTGAPT